MPLAFASSPVELVSPQLTLWGYKYLAGYAGSSLW
jgi:hypothetical protein